ncbi:nuclear egress lamina protein [Rhinolophus gammaherpesvirus 1]|uniref:Nuclear egress lamina protein n=1 Tax=Rhinolophus gammaherpesvirus 1 TaxID=2054179 RepID=A0A2Z5U6E7_9GAMA|nr:nuclear egress lamina protein [Rhinolophus gammaherpesvirus 1]BBB06523.1 nuclear egress lamina protein [Rhinolophus gammaherpesvirus 1]
MAKIDQGVKRVARPSVSEHSLVSKRSKKIHQEPLSPKKDTNSTPTRHALSRARASPRHRCLFLIFFNGITLNSEFGKDFLREMDTPICTSKIICLPLDVNQIAPGRCLVLSPLGHTCNMGFHCERCTRAENHSYSHFQAASPSTINPGSKDFNSVTLTFYNHASKVVQNKNLYLSLLSHSLNTVKQSFSQPSLLYIYIVLRTLCEDVFPIFVEGDKGLLCMYTIFKQDNLHIGEACLRLLIDNLVNYKVTLDCIRQTYVLKFEPLCAETNTMAVQEQEICESVTGLDYTDEIKQEIVNGQELVSDF